MTRTSFGADEAQGSGSGSAAADRSEPLATEPESGFRSATEATRAIVYEVDLTGPDGVGVATAHGVDRVVGEDGGGAVLESAWWHARIHPADLPGHLEHLAATVADRSAATYRAAYRVRHVDGGWRDVEDTAMVVRDEDGVARRLVGTILDVTEQRRAREALSSARVRLQSALDAGSIGTWSWDAVSDTTIADERTARLFGLDPDEAARGVPRERYLAAIHRDDRERVALAVREAAAGGTPYDAEYRVCVGDDVHWLRSRGRVHAVGGRPVAVIGALMDITEQKAAEAALLEREASLRRALAAKDEFLGLVSHELRTPMTVILGMSKVLARPDADPERVREVAADIVESADVLNGLIESMLLLARLDRDEASKLREPVLLDRLTRDVVTRLAGRDPGREYRTRVFSHDALVDVQPVWLERVVENLVGNAAKYSAPGRPIRVVVGGDEREVHVHVIDEGDVLAADDLEHVFEAFYRSPHGRERAAGAGLGLAVAKRIVELLDGRIVARPRPAGGAHFAFSIPRLISSEP